MNTPLKHYLKCPTTWLTLALCAMVILYFGCALHKVNAEKKSAKRVSIASIDIDVSRLGPPALGAGLMHGPAPLLDSKTGKLIKKLHPVFWRTANSKTLKRAKKYGARRMLVVSDYWGYPQNGLPRGRPYDNPEKWQNFMTKAAHSHPDVHWIWDIWNEPDLSTFFDGTTKQYYSVFITADRILHKLRGPQVQVAGPSTAVFFMKGFTQFAEALMKANVKLEVLAWHENSVPAKKAYLITKHLKQARKRFIDNPKYAALGVKKLMITEYAGPDDWMRPAAIVAFRAALEAGHADAAARACWKISGKNMCGNGSMDGLIDPDREQPRAAWWTVRALVPQNDRRILTKQPEVWHVVANKHSLVLGSLKAEQTILHLHFKGLEQENGALRVCGRVIPDTGKKVVPKLPKQRCHNIYVKDHQAAAYWHAPPQGAALWLQYTAG